ncbi:sarcosine oxidase subunit alpha [Cohaesibacter sp. ES.047]|uniref:sarcosine oxidase subunit alpha family protein n=1 Tax=Cohaesibacter sp. ES.047 TaxID=1798205 RepID=UPI000BB8A5B6|nr:sarcosine oxidase subunit alpha family protein [Cohaesibacter sp. ES.047]SNY93540.1 sarcosine oxidase subunit alpha [Cohaesibacter sp. ES.047]
MTDNRLPTGGLINRSQPIRFQFNGTYYMGYEGDTLASALLANDIHMVARSFKYGRPRGIMTAGPEEPNAIVQLNRVTSNCTEPATKATEVPLRPSLVASQITAAPSLDYDLKSLGTLMHKGMAAGFYYKMMFGSRLLWHHLFEPMIRRAAGFGKAPQGADPDVYDHMHRHVDILVVGAGPAGLAAAREAAASGARVMIADMQGRFGGSLMSQSREIDGQPGLEWVDGVVNELAASDEVTLLPNTNVFGYYDQNYLMAVEKRLDHTGEVSSPDNCRQRLWHIRASKVILATGSHERPLVFGDNDRPGIMLAGSVQTYINRYAVLPGKRAILFANNDAAYEAALDFRKAGGDLVAVIDSRFDPSGPLYEEVFATGTMILRGHVVTSTLGNKRFTGLDAAPWDGEALIGKTQRLEADILMMSGGYSSVVHLFSHAGGKLRYDEDAVCFRPDRYGQKDAVCVGAANGEFTLADALRAGSREGTKALKETGFEGRKTARRYRVVEPDTGLPEPCWLAPSDHPVGKGPSKHFVDYQNDTTAADIHLAAREGFESVEHMKRYTLTGFGTDQGKLGNVNGLAILSEVSGISIPDTGTTTFRPPYTPVTFGALAGRAVDDLSDPVRTTSIHEAHVKLGAEFENVGQWKRPWFYPRGNEGIDEAVRRECQAVRFHVGMLDASTLGKIDVKGPDAAEFLNRIYTNNFAALKPGRCRYGIMCGEDGMVMDDGVTARLANDHFTMTTTTGGAAAVLDHLEDYLQTEWPELDVYCTSVTEQWATIAINGPLARQVMQALNPDVDWSAEAFPFMSFQQVDIGGVKARVFRISFTGELAFEINVPSRYGLSLWRMVCAAGEPFGITPYGTETMHVLRAEKGFIIVGQDTDGSVTPQDLDMDWIVSKKKDDFIGKRSFSRPDTSRSDRKQLVGLLTDDPTFVLDEGAQILENPDAPTPIPMLGHVTSSYWSEHLGHSIAFALIKNGFRRKGDYLHSFSLGNWQKVKVVDPIFYDKSGARRDG